MAVIWKSRGTLGAGSTDSGTCLPLALIEDRLFGVHKVLYRGEESRPIADPKPDFEYVVVEVTGLDIQTPMFDRRGFYLVLGLHADDAAFLVEPEFPTET